MNFLSIKVPSKKYRIYSSLIYFTLCASTTGYILIAGKNTSFIFYSLLTFSLLNLLFVKFAPQELQRYIEIENGLFRIKPIGWLNAISLPVDSIEFFAIAQSPDALLSQPEATIYLSNGKIKRFFLDRQSIHTIIEFLSRNNIQARNFLEITQ